MPQIGAIPDYQDPNKVPVISESPRTPVQLGGLKSGAIARLMLTLRNEKGEQAWGWF